MFLERLAGYGKVIEHDTTDFVIQIDCLVGAHHCRVLGGLRVHIQGQTEIWHIVEKQGADAASTGSVRYLLLPLPVAVIQTALFIV